MSEGTRTALERVAREVEVGPAPLDTLLSAGHAARRRRRTVVASCALAAAVVVVGGGVVAGQTLMHDSSAPGDDLAARPSPTVGPHELDVRVALDSTARTHRLLAPVDARGGPVWVPEDRAVYYATGYDFSTGCPPAATAQTGILDGVTLTLDVDRSQGECRSDVRRAMVVIDGLERAPRTLTVVENGVKTRVPVTVAGTTPTPSTTTAPSATADCAAGDLAAEFRTNGEGAAGHYIWLLDVRNTGSSACTLTGYPDQVTLSEPGRAGVTATNDSSFFPAAPTKASLQPGAATTLGLETQSVCAARPGGGPAGPLYHQVTVEVPGGTITATAPAGLDVGCGVHLTPFTDWQ